MRCTSLIGLMRMSLKIPRTFFEELGHIEDLPEPFSDMFDPKRVANDRLLHWLMRAGLASLEDLCALAAKGLLFIGDAVHALPILGGEEANEAIRDAVYLSEVMYQSPVSDFDQFYYDRFPRWNDSIQKSQSSLKEMHRASRPAL